MGIISIANSKDSDHYSSLFSRPLDFRYQIRLMNLSFFNTSGIILENEVIHSKAIAMDQTREKTTPHLKPCHPDERVL